MTFICLFGNKQKQVLIPQLANTCEPLFAMITPIMGAENEGARNLPYLAGFETR